ARMAVARRTAAKVSAANRLTRSTLGQEVPDHSLGLPVRPFPDVGVAHHALSIDEDRRWPGPVGVAPPDREVVVLHHRILDPEIARGGGDLVEGLFPRELRRVDADDREALLLVLRVPVPQLRDHVLAVVSAVGPELDVHDAAAQLLQAEGLAVDP